MAIDYRRLAAAAVEAAFNDDGPAAVSPEPAHRKKGHLKGVGTVAAGAALVAAGHYAVKKAPALPKWAMERKLPDLPDFEELQERARDLWDDFVHAGDGYDDEPSGESDEDVDDEADPDADPDADEDVDDEADGDADEEDDEEFEDHEHDERIDPPARPPKPPQRKRSSGRKTKANA